MSKPLSFREVAAQQGRDPDVSPAPSGTPIAVRLKRTGGLSRPIDIVRVLKTVGVTLRRAHACLNALAERDVATVEIWTDDVRHFAEMLKPLNVEAHPIVVPDINPKAVREKLGVSQTEFALRFGIEVDTIQNWEQSRSKPDASARILLALIAADPAWVDSMLSETSRWPS